MFKKFFGYDSPVVRNIDSEYLLENFLVAAVSSIFAIRFFLKITDYPLIGGGNFHIAHMLWGGVFMMIAIVILIAFFSRSAANIAAVIGGIGFGTFIDELGKFITSDNNYFYQPTVALLYVIFILLYLAFRAIDKHRVYSKKEYLINSIEMLKEAVLNDMDEEEKERALTFLSKSDQRTAVVKALKELLEKSEPSQEESPHPLLQFKQHTRNVYYWAVKKKWFAQSVISFFVLQSLVSLFNNIIVFTDLPQLSITQWGRVVSTLISSFFVLIGILYFYKNRLYSYRLFKRSVLVSIFLTQFFLFYKDQFLALFGLSINLITLLTLDYIINQEQRKDLEKNYKIDSL